MLHLSIIPFYPLYRVVNPRFTRLILLLCPTTHKPRWCTRFDLLVLSSSPSRFTNVYRTRLPLLVYL
jgi:hypothetical protein